MKQILLACALLLLLPTRLSAQEARPVRLVDQQNGRVVARLKKDSGPFPGRRQCLRMRGSLTAPTPLPFYHCMDRFTAMALACSS